MDHQTLWNKIDSLEKELEESNKILETWLTDFAYELGDIKQEIKKNRNAFKNRIF